MCVYGGLVDSDEWEVESCPGPRPEASGVVPRNGPGSRVESESGGFERQAWALLLALVDLSAGIGNPFQSLQKIFPIE